MANEQYFTLGGYRAVSGRITFGMLGAWRADVVLAGETVPTGRTTLKFADVELSGTARTSRTGRFGGKSSARVVAGADGWNNVIPSKGYALDQGIKVSLILQDAATAAKETIVVADTSSSVGPNWCRRKGRASRVLRLLLNDKWWIDDAGVTQTKTRDSSKIATPFTVIQHRPEIGEFEIATESFNNWRPGRKFQSLMMAREATISTVSIEITDGKIRLRVTDDSTPEDRLISLIRSVIRDEVARLEHGSIVEYEITRAAEMEIDCKPTAGPDSPWPPLAKVRLKAGLLGEVNTPTVGKKCLIVFMDDDPALYRCIGVEGPNQKTTFETSGNVEVTTGGIFKVCGGGNFVALANLVKANFDTVQSRFDSHTHGTGVGPTTPPIVPIASLPDVKCSKLKTD